MIGCRRDDSRLRGTLPLTLFILLFLNLGASAIAADYSLACSRATLAGDQPLPTLDDILERYIEVLGGREAIEDLTTRFAVGQVITDLSSRSEPIYEEQQLELFCRRPNHFVIVRHTTSGPVSDGWNGDMGWRQGPSGSKRVDSIKRSRFAWFANPRGPLLMKEYFPGMSVSCTWTLEGRNLYVVDTAYDFSLYFDVETGLLMRLGFNRKLQDYRRVGEVLVPHKLILSRKGGATSYSYREIRHNIPLPDSRFTAPLP
ncbi:MAG: outer membrane lipoprotein-sorting protein [bacterium]|nr:outer membrane lipoprotein-sorting protein [bacterium]